MDFEIIIRFLLAALWGGLVGAEREYRSKAAGFRTMIMISIGACFFTIMSVRIGVESDRIASNIVTGIDFLGAGVIFRGDNRVNGITTAATIWVVAAIGMGIGGGYYLASACGSILILIVLGLLPYTESLIDNYNHTKAYKISCTYSPEMITYFETILEKSKLKYRLTNKIKDGTRLILSWDIQGKNKDHTRLAQVLMEDSKIERLEC